MCRIAYIPNPSEWALDELTDLFTYLDKFGGGSGIGVGWIDKTTNKAEIHKSLGMSPVLAAQVIKNAENDVLNGALFHTRIPSVGMKCDTLCMPFPIGDDCVYVYNGTWRDWRMAYYAMIGRGLPLPPPPLVSDAMVAAALLQELGLDYSSLIDNGVSVIMSPEGVFLAKSTTGDFGRAQNGLRTMFASRFPPSNEWINDKEVKACSKLNIAEPLKSSALCSYTRAGGGRYSYTKNKAGNWVQHLPPKKKTKKKVKVLSTKKKSLSSSTVVLNDKKENFVDKNLLKEKMRAAVLFCMGTNSSSGMFSAIEWNEVLDVRTIPNFPGLQYVEVENLKLLGTLPAQAGCIVALASLDTVESGGVIFTITDDGKKARTWVRDIRWILPIWVDITSSAMFDYQKENWWTAKVGVLQEQKEGHLVMSPITYPNEVMSGVALTDGDAIHHQPLYSLARRPEIWNKWKLITLESHLDKLGCVASFFLHDNAYFAEMRRTRLKAKARLVNHPTCLRQMWYEGKSEERIPVFEHLEGEDEEWEALGLAFTAMADEMEEEAVNAHTPKVIARASIPTGEGLLWMCANCGWVTDVIPESCSVCGKKSWKLYKGEMPDWVNLEDSTMIKAAKINASNNKMPTRKVPFSHMSSEQYYCIECGGITVGTPKAPCAGCGGEFFVSKSDVTSYGEILTEHIFSYHDLEPFQ